MLDLNHVVRTAAILNAHCREGNSLSGFQKQLEETIKLKPGSLVKICASGIQSFHMIKWETDNLKNFVL